MNIKTIIVGSLALGLAIGSIFFNVTSENSKALYTPRTINNGVYGQAGYAEYMYMLKADPATGKIDYNLVNQTRNQIIARTKQNNKTALGLTWNQMGPDNVGGRTRAILVDRFNSNTVYAGSISGGLFVSTDGTQHWTPVSGQNGILGENLAISCITQTDNGRIFFGTGSSFEGAQGIGGSGFIGNGVYEYVPSTGQVLPVLTNTGVAPNNSPSAQLSIINAIVSKGNRLYIGTRDGMLWADSDVSGFYPTTFSGWTNPIEIVSGIPEVSTCYDIDIASNGSMLVCFAGRIYTSPNDQLGSFVKTNMSGARICGAIAPSNPNVLYALRMTGSPNFGHLISLDISLDGGSTWSVIVPGGSYCIDPFLQNSCDVSGGQATYDATIAVDPSDWGHVLVGGIQLYEWRYSPGSSPIGGSWLKAANLFESVMNPFYVHADKHTIVWPDANTIYIGSDGGVTRSIDGGASFQERNLGYNVTTFYDVQTSANGFIVGGAQDNGTQLFTFGSLGEVTPLGTFAIGSGDGFDVAFSNQSPGVVYFTSQYGSLLRSAGGIGGTFYDADLFDVVSNPQPFHTVIENWESNYDTTSVDFIKLVFDSIIGTEIAPGDTVFAGDTIFAGTTIWYKSLTNDIDINYTTPTNIIINYPIDTLLLKDYIQNRFALRTSTGIYFTRDAARLNSLSSEWFRISDNIITTTSSAECMEFSPDGNHLFIGTSSGTVIRISGLSLANDSLGLDIRNLMTSSSTPDSNRVTTQVTIGSGFNGVVTGLAADPNDGNNMIATVSGYNNGNHVYRCTNALTATTNSFSPIQGAGGTVLPFMPVYDAEIDYNDNNKVIIGTEWGVWSTDNAFSAIAGSLVNWADESSNGMAHVPVFAVEQQHLRSTDATNSGYIYLGTHGRGFYSSPTLFTAVEEPVGNFSDVSKNGFVSNLSVYPNPMKNLGKITFDLNKDSETIIKIYNLTGSLVKQIDLGKITKGKHKEDIDVSSLSVGSYIVSLESGTERSVAKFIVTR